MAVDRIAIVTGGGSGIGRACALALAEAGWRVVIAGRRIEPLTETAAMAIQVGSVSPCAGDLRDPGDVAALFRFVVERHGRLDLLFNNAGVNAAATPLEELTLADWSRVLETNVTASFLCAQAAVRQFKAQHPQGGRIINNGSISAHVPRPLSAAYTTSKHAITGLTRSLSLDGRPYDIVCGQIDIGNAETDLARRMATGVLQADGTTAAEPLMDVRHVARAVVYMASLPLEANVQFLTVAASKMKFIGRG